MSRAKKHHIPGLGERLRVYADSRSLDHHQYSPYHHRIMDGGYVILDVWTTGRYFVLSTNYIELTDDVIQVERGGENGKLPDKLAKFLDDLFFPEGIRDEI